MMHSLKILGLEVDVPPGHFEFGVSQNPLEPKRIATIAKVGRRERMP